MLRIKLEITLKRFDFTARIRFYSIRNKTDECSNASLISLRKKYNSLLLYNWAKSWHVNQKYSNENHSELTFWKVSLSNRHCIVNGVEHEEKW